MSNSESMRRYKHSKKGLIVANRSVKKYYQRNKEQIYERRKVYLRTHAKNRKYLMMANGTGITNQQWDEILRKYNFRCAYCGIQGNMTMDHVVPVSKGGEHSPNNVVPACAGCNQSKGTKLSWKPKILRKEG